jgi:hypothetical protein
VVRPGYRKLEFQLGARQLSLISEEAKRVIEPGVCEVSVGGKQTSFPGLAGASTTETVSTSFEITGKTTPVE